MNLIHPETKESFKQLSLIFTVILLGIFLFAGFVVLFIITDSGGIVSENHKSYFILKWIFVGLVIVLIPFAIVSHRKYTDRIDKSLPLKIKLLKYRNSFIGKILIISFICMFNSVLLFIYGDLYLLIPLVLFIFYFLLNRPYIEKIAEELDLNYNEKSELKE